MVSTCFSMFHHFKDTLAALDMSGVDPHKWRRLDNWAVAAAAISAASDSTSAAAGPLLLGHKGPNYRRVEAKLATGNRRENRWIRMNIATMLMICVFLCCKWGKCLPILRLVGCCRYKIGFRIKGCSDQKTCGNTALKGPQRQKFDEFWHHFENVLCRYMQLVGFEGLKITDD